MCPLSCGELKERQRADEREERETLLVSYVQRLDAPYKRHLIDTCACAWVTWDMYVYSWMDGWCVWRGATVGVMANLASGRF